MPFNSIIMPYKQNCKVEGEVITKFKIAKLYFGNKKSQREISNNISCHYNTVGSIIKKCKQFWSKEVSEYLSGHNKLSESQLELFNFLKSGSRRPLSNKRSLLGQDEELILNKHSDSNYGPKRIFTHLTRQNYDMENFTLAKIKGVYKRNNLKTRKIRTANGERRALYDYAQLAAFEECQYDTKEITDMHSLPIEIYERFKYAKELPRYQWTFVDAKTRIRFLAWSYHLDSFLGFKFLEFVICWLRAHGVMTSINTQMDGGLEFCLGSKRKLADWNNRLAQYNASVCQTEGSKWKQNLVERTHRTDDEEFYCPRGEYIKNKGDFLVEGQNWIVYYNHRSNDGIGLEGISPKDKLEQLGYYNAEDIVNRTGIVGWM